MVELSVFLNFRFFVFRTMNLIQIKLNPYYINRSKYPISLYVRPECSILHDLEFRAKPCHIDGEFFEKIFILKWPAGISTLFRIEIYVYPFSFMIYCRAVIMALVSRITVLFIEGLIYKSGNFLLTKFCR